MATVAQNKAFVENLIPAAWPLDDALAWISSTLDPDDVFTEEQLKKWAEDHGYQEVE